MRILVDATDQSSRLEVFGMTLLERQLHSIVSAGLTPTAIDVALAPGAPAVFFSARKLEQPVPLALVF